MSIATAICVNSQPSAGGVSFYSQVERLVCYEGYRTVYCDSEMFDNSKKCLCPKGFSERNWGLFPACFQKNGRVGKRGIGVPGFCEIGKNSKSVYEEQKQNSIERLHTVHRCRRDGNCAGITGQSFDGGTYAGIAGRPAFSFDNPIESEGRNVVRASVTGCDVRYPHCLLRPSYFRKVGMMRLYYLPIVVSGLIREYNPDGSMKAVCSDCKKVLAEGRPEMSVKDCELKDVMRHRQECRAKKGKVTGEI